MRSPQRGRCACSLVPFSGLVARAAGASVGRMRALLGVAAEIGRRLACGWWDSSELEWGRRSGQYRIGYTGYIAF